MHTLFTQIAPALNKALQERIASANGADVE
jgi:hypothetical protein